jgi:hypothetical protein
LNARKVDEHCGVRPIFMHRLAHVGANRKCALIHGSFRCALNNVRKIRLTALSGFEALRFSIRQYNRYKIVMDMTRI